MSLSEGKAGFPQILLDLKEKNRRAGRTFLQRQGGLERLTDFYRSQNFTANQTAYRILFAG